MSTEEIRAIELLGRVSYGRLATSMRAMPFVAPARHVVSDGTVVIRMHEGLGYHRACNGGVVAYGADNLDSGSDSVWSVQFTGTAEIVEPTEAERAAFGPEPVRVDGEPFVPVYMRIVPRFVTVHSLDYPETADSGPPASSEAPTSGPPASSEAPTSGPPASSGPPTSGAPPSSGPPTSGAPPSSGPATSAPSSAGRRLRHAA